MHAYLISVPDEERFIEEAKKLAKKSDSKTLEFSVRKIEDARSLNSFLNLSQSEKTMILIKDFQNATEECANAILKTIEEPQDNVSFAIHTTNENLILPTIRSRCAHIKLSANSTRNVSAGHDGFSDDVSDKIKLIEGKTREEVLEYANQLIREESFRISDGKSGRIDGKKTEALLRFKRAIEQNGNAKLQFLRYICDISTIAV